MPLVAFALFALFACSSSRLLQTSAFVNIAQAKSAEAKTLDPHPLRLRIRRLVGRNQHALIEVCGERVLPPLACTRAASALAIGRRQDGKTARLIPGKFGKFGKFATDANSQ